MDVESLEALHDLTVEHIQVHATSSNGTIRSGEHATHLPLLAGAPVPGIGVSPWGTIPLPESWRRPGVRKEGSYL